MQWSDTSGNTGILQEIQRSLKDSPASPHWPVTDLLRRANIVIRQICEESECLKVTDTSNVSVIGTATYNKPAGCSRIVKVAYAGIRKFGITEAELDMANPKWQSEPNSTPQRYIDNPGTIVFYPAPAAAGDTISIQYITQPNELVNVTDIPFNGRNDLYSFHDIIVAGVVYRCLLEERNQFYAEWKTMYEKGMDRLKDFVRKQPDTMLTSKDLGINPAHDTFPVPRPWLY